MTGDPARASSATRASSSPTPWPCRACATSTATARSPSAPSLAGVDQLLMAPGHGRRLRRRARRRAERPDQHEASSTQSVRARPAAEVPPRHLRPARTPTRPRLGRVVGTPAHLAAADAITDRTTTVLRNDDSDPAAARLRHEGPRHRVRRHDHRHPRGRPHAGAVHGRRVARPGAAPTDAAIADAVAAGGRPGRRGGHDDEGLGHRGHRPARRPAEAGQGAARHRQAGRRRGGARPLRHRLLHRGAAPTSRRTPTARSRSRRPPA